MKGISHIRLITDSVADLPRDIAQQYNIQVIPVHVILGEQRYLDNGTLSHDSFYQALYEGNVYPSTAAPAPHTFLKAYQQLANEGAEHIIALFAASNVSSIFAHAQIAAQQLDTATVHLVDTTQVSMGIGGLVQLAAEAITQGASLEATIDLVTAARKRTQILGILNSVQHLQRSGRVSWAVARFVELLHIKPLISFVHGEAQLIGRVRTYHRAYQRLVTLITQRTPLERVTVIHSRAKPQWITQLQQAMFALTPEQEVRVIEVGPVFGSHVGAQCLGVALIQVEN